MQWRFQRFCILVVSFSIAATPVTTRPATQPTKEELDALKYSILDASKNIVSLKEQVTQCEKGCIRRLHSSPSQKSIDEEVNQANIALQQARQSGTSQEKLDASSKYSQLKQKVDKLEIAALKSDPSIKDSKAQLDNAQKQLADKEKQLAKIDAELAAQAEYKAKHFKLIEALDKLNAIRNEADLSEGRSEDKYTHYRIATSKIVRSADLLYQFSIVTPIDEGDFATLMDQVISDTQQWQSKLSEKEAIYASADHIRTALKLFSNAYGWLTLSNKNQKESDKLANENQLDSSIVVGRYGLDAGVKGLSDKKSAHEHLEQARRLLITEENTKPALP